MKLTEEQLAELQGANYLASAEAITELNDLFRDNLISLMDKYKIPYEDTELFDDDWFDYWDNQMSQVYDLSYPTIKQELFK